MRRTVLTVIHFFFFNDTATTEIYTLSLHDALPIWWVRSRTVPARSWQRSIRSRSPYAASRRTALIPGWASIRSRSEEHTSELQSQSNLVCRLLLEKKKKTHIETNSRSSYLCCSRTR